LINSAQIALSGPILPFFYLTPRRSIGIGRATFGLKGKFMRNFITVVRERIAGGG